MLEYPLILVLVIGGWLYHLDLRRAPQAECDAEMTELRDHENSVSKRLLITMAVYEKETTQQLDLLRRALSTLSNHQGCDYLMPRLEDVLCSLSPKQLQQVRHVVATLRNHIPHDGGVDLWCVTTVQTMVDYVWRERAMLSAQGSPSRTPSSTDPATWPDVVPDVVDIR